MLNKFDIATIFPKDMLVICVSCNRSIDTNWMLPFTNLKAFDDTKKKCCSENLYHFKCWRVHRGQRERTSKYSNYGRRFSRVYQKSSKVQLNKMRIY